jgi:ACR3 family arsenite transporter
MLMFALAVLFLPDRPEYMTGLILIGSHRASRWCWCGTSLPAADPHYVAALVAFNSLFQIVFYTPTPWLLLAKLPPLFGLALVVVRPR